MGRTGSQKSRLKSGTRLTPARALKCGFDLGKPATRTCTGFRTRKWYMWSDRALEWVEVAGEPEHPCPTMGFRRSDSVTPRRSPPENLAAWTSWFAETIRSAASQQSCRLLISPGSR